MKYATTIEGDKIVSKDIEVIQKAVEGKKFDSLILFGAFGKGEGLVLDGRPRNDYDLLLVGGSQDLAAELITLPLGVQAEVHLVSQSDLENIECSQQWFEIKYASQLLAGKPLQLPEWNTWDIPFSDAVNSLNRRAISMMVGKWEMGKDSPDQRKVTEQICKGIIAVGDATLIKRGQFSPLYAHRALLLSQDDIGANYALAVSMKLTGFPEVTQDKLWEMWHITRTMMREYVIDNQVQSEVLELLFAIDDRTEREDLKALIEKLGASKWL